MSRWFGEEFLLKLFLSGWARPEASVVIPGNVYFWKYLTEGNAPEPGSRGAGPLQNETTWKSMWHWAYKHNNLQKVSVDVIQSAFCFFIVHLWCCLQSRTSSRVIEVLPWKLNMLRSQYCSKLQVSVVYRVCFHWDRFLLSLWTLKSENVTFYENVIF